MKTKIIIGIALSALLSGGCASVTGSNVGDSTLIGAGTGAIIGQVAGGDTQSTLVGAALGAAGGALMNGYNENKRQDQYREYQYRNNRYYNRDYYDRVEP